MNNPYRSPHGLPSSGYPQGGLPQEATPQPSDAGSYDIVESAQYVAAPAHSVLGAMTNGPSPLADRPPVEHGPMTMALPPHEEHVGRNKLAAALTVLVAIIGIWSVLGYVGSMSKTLSSTLETNKKIKGQLTEANSGLVQLDTKTANVAKMTKGSAELATLMGGLDSDMGAMIDGVESIGTQMESVSGALDGLNSEIETVNATNAQMESSLGTINSTLSAQATKVRGLRKDVDSTATELGGVPPLLTATNSRLTHINKVVCQMGTKGLQNPLKVYITFLGIPNGNAEIAATMIPPGAWLC